MIFKELNFIAFYFFVSFSQQCKNIWYVSSCRGRALYFHLLSTISNMSSNYQPKTETEATKE